MTGQSQYPHRASIARKTIGDGVYEVLKARLMDRELEPGSKVNMEQVGRDLGVSPTPVREALAALEVEGLVTKEPLVGYTVAPRLDRTGFDNLWEARLLLEPVAAHLAAQRAESQTRTAILAAASERAGVGGHALVGELAGRDARFHSLINAASGNPTLADWFDRLHAHVHFYRLNHDLTSGVAADAEHQEIAEAIVAQDAAGAQGAMAEHLTKARDRLATAFEQG